MYLGEYDHQLDEKNRLRVPAKIRKQIGKDYVVTKGTNSCLFVFPKNEMEDNLIGKFRDVSILDEKAKMPIRFLFSSAFTVEEDKQGRFVLPKALKEYANIEKEIVFIGMGSYLEIWGRAEWSKYTQSKEFSPEMFKGVQKNEL